MKKSTLRPSIFVNKVENHNTHKKVLLDYFSKQSTKFNNISNTDWLKSEDTNRDWVNYSIDKIITPLGETLTKELSAHDMIVENIWFQQYNNSDSHGWHNHPRAQFTNVYYIELPDGMKTELLGEEDIDIKEGDILTFPAYIFHQSKTNESKERKTVVSFNTSFDRINVDKMNKT